ncbi:ribonuclease R [Mycoplasmoides gallisepticum]|uniref:ribonuclease R n=1 Tax=Mycoplasmoides gallisepticum TaxID=2096 RepID=UPI0012454317|nr:ribonuclease R [Mycoplasmoides gallisepticum]QEX47385.1 ribonuclease R [Mycoplasmoides gallisepticum]ULH61996.1 ribonuclease R [Mycoplasmoides gallisepticum]ULH67338.1 ribonuclease R [Mycoplasmoides gallisepticum]ULH68064.1 ribonuclease R [Mycoplasmoides gallisepticum]WGG23662.1 ribonuclease R [Mycoplasmoides gallisepticum]
MNNNNNRRKIINDILQIVRLEDKKPIPPGIIVKKLDNRYTKTAIYKEIDKMLANGELKKLANNKVVLGYQNSAPDLSKIMVGRLAIGTNGNGFIKLENEELSKYYVHNTNLNNALNNDLVEFAPLTVQNDWYKHDLTDACILKVLERARTRYVGTYEDTGDEYLVLPDDPKLIYKVVLDRHYLELKEHDRILFEIIEIKQGVIRAALVKKIGSKEDLGIDIDAIAYNHLIEPTFSQEIINEAKSLKYELDDHQKAIRKDLRDLSFLTIDPASALDLDDAIYVKKIDDDSYNLKVAIADVCHYVKFDGPMDRGARTKATSVYLANKVIPMLPEELSNDLCSLNPEVDKFVIVGDLMIDGTGKIMSHEFYPAIINSHKRFSYEEVNEYFSATNDLKDVDPSIRQMLDEARVLAKILRRMKIKRGYLQFDVDETSIELDDRFEPINILKKPHGEAQEMIEDFMVAANEAVCLFASKYNLDFIYRVHPKPAVHKLNSFANWARTLEFEIFGDLNSIKSTDIQKWLTNNADHKQIKLINKLLLRSMNKAYYSVENTRHFSLASKHYTHFTSPIRRYADNIVHRILWMFVFDPQAYTDLQRNELKSHLVEWCDLINKQELVAVDCERDVNAFLYVKYMSNFLGNWYHNVTINAITNFGMFVELHNGIEGLVRLNNINGDYYRYDPNTDSLVGRNNHKKYQIGDTVDVRLLSADKRLKRIDFAIHEDNKCK